MIDTKTKLDISKAKTTAKERSNDELWVEIAEYRKFIKESNKLVDTLVDANKKWQTHNTILRDKCRIDMDVIDEMWDDYQNAGVLRDSIFDYYKMVRSKTSIERILAKLPTPKEAPEELSDDEPSIHEKLAELESNSYMEV
jgi:hypothetical protein